ncbi:MAG: TonB-dependent receptor [Bacteroidales bacterium]|nr:TonB-dependent receptor [Bacteroidales bacterium]
MKKILLIMRLSLFFLLISVFNVSATVYSQSTKISLSLSNASLSEVLEHIEKSSDYRFLYRKDYLDLNKKINITAKNSSIEHVLKNVLSNYEDLSYSLLKDNLIVIAPTNIAWELTGTVTDESGNPIPGVTVSVKGKPRGTITDLNGSFTLEVNEGDVLIFSFIGYQTKMVTIVDQKVINITLIESVQQLDEVVITGYGTQRIKDVTGSISNISTDDIESRPMLQFQDALQGKAAGVQIISPSGKPQSGAFIRIRGTTSIDGSSEPLYVVDGVPSENMQNINPNDIESITILKDASAAAIYGSSGANGVVIINTKRGVNKKPTVEFNSYFGFSKVMKYIDVLNSQEYIDLMNELGLSTDWSQYTANTNWQDEVLRTAGNSSYQLSLSGSDDKTNYYVSGNWTKQDGIVRKNTADRYSGKINFDRQVNSWLKAGTSILYSKWHDVNITDNIGAGRGGVILGMLTTPEVIGVFNPDGTYTGNPLQTSWENPVASTDAPEQDYYQTRFQGNFYVEANITKSLKFKSLISLETSNGKYNYFLDPYRTDWGRVNQGIAEESSDKTEYWLSENTIRFNKKFGKNTFAALAGFIVSNRKYNSLFVRTTHFANTAVKTIDGGAIIEDVSSSYTERSNLSQIARINYDFDNKYLLTANFRADASSVFGPGKRWGYFPSFSVGWRISEETFLSGIDAINDIKLRIGWGQVGNDRIQEYAWYGTVGTGYNYVIGGTIVPGISIETMENKDLKWETTSQTDIGLDVLLFNYRLGLTIDAYLKNTSDLLLSMPVPRSTGFESTIQNVGEIQNRGIEILITTKNFVNEFKWNTDFNISFNENKVVYLNEQIINSGWIYQRGNVAIAKEGESMGSFYGYVAQGVDPATGLMIYKDVNGDGEFTPDDKQIIGNANPKFIYGLNNTFSYKGFDLSIFLQGVYGNDIFNATRIETESMNDFKSQQATVLNRWKNPGDITDMPAATLGEKYNSELSTRFIEDGSYLRVKSLTLSYTLPQSVIGRLKLSKLRFYVTGENLYTFTKYSGYDPEVNAFGGDNLAQGIDFGTYPQSRNIIFGLNLSF